MIFTDKAAKEKITQLEAQVSQLESDNAALTGQVESLQADITAKDQTIAEHVAAIAAKDEKITAMQEDLDTAMLVRKAKESAIENLREELAEAKESAGKLAVEQLAAIGQSAPLSVDDGRPVSHLETFNKLTGHAATAYWKKHQKEIRAEQRAQDGK